MTKPRTFTTAKDQTGITNIWQMTELSKYNSVKDNPDNGQEVRIEQNWEMKGTVNCTELRITNNWELQRSYNYKACIVAKNV